MTITPDPFDELIGRRSMIRPHQERYQHTLLPDMADVNEATVDAHIDGTKQAELDRHLDHRSARFSV